MRSLRIGIILGVLGLGMPTAGWAQGMLENPQPGSFQSGAIVLSGWVCEAALVELEIDEMTTLQAAYGTSREDTRGVCGDADNGFGLLFNANLFGEGEHSVRALADGVEFGQATFQVTTFAGQEMLVGASGRFPLADFPAAGMMSEIIWQESLQNFALASGAGGGGGTSGTATQQLENPQPGSFQGGLGVLSGFVCDADRIDIEIDGTTTLQAAYGTSREDTRGVCGDADNGFGLLWNWNLVGAGEHTVRALADGVEFASATFTVTTFGVEFLQGASGQFALADFPNMGDETTVRWQESIQNFAIVATNLQIGSGPGFQSPIGTTHQDLEYSSHSV